MRELFRLGGASVSLTPGMVTPDSHYVTDLWTKKSHRGKGRARLLMTLLCEHADHRGLTLCLVVDPDDESFRERLTKFYNSLGFVETRSAYPSWMLFRPPRPVDSRR